VRRIVTLLLSLAVLLGVSSAGLVAQDDAKKEQAKSEAKKDEQKKDDPKKDEAKKDEPKKDAPKAEPPLPTVPPEVEAKRQAALKAVADLIVSAQDAGLVDTTIDPPPILEILLTGRATDARTLKAKLEALKANPNDSPEAGLDPEAFGAWWTGSGKLEGATAEKNVRIMQPSKGLQDFYDRRASELKAQIAEIRKTRPAPAPKEEVKKDETKKDETKKEEPKKDEAKKDETKKDDGKKDEPKKDESKK
jgi:hypothetical protein